MQCKLHGNCAKGKRKGARTIIMKNGRPATQGIRPVCGVKIFKRRTS